ncbi:unnamed protein product [Discosporangium mesarthrocarpum]
MGNCQTLDNESLDLKFDEKGFFKAYKLGPVIGFGACSTVHEATRLREPGKGKKFAVKVISKKTLAKDRKPHLFREVNIMRSLKHPNILEIYQFFQDEPKNYYLVIELIHGKELLNRVIMKNSYTEKEARDVSRVLLNTICFLHSKGIVHRDLKLENLLLTSLNDNANIKVADFGFSQTTDSRTLTTQCGTPGYMAPEIIRGKPYGKEVDMWSAGIIIYILIAGYPPFQDKSLVRLYQKIKAGKVRFPKESWEFVSSAAKDLIVQLLTTDPSKRLTAAEAVRHPWLLSKDTDLLQVHLKQTLEHMQLFNARRKLRAAVKSVVAVNTLANSHNIPHVN